jgi:outer membrane protein OmpA-like peptidoglycan-associated protein
LNPPVRLGVAQHSVAVPGEAHAFYAFCSECAGPTPKTPFSQQDEPITKTATAAKGTTADGHDRASDNTRSNDDAPSAEAPFTAHFAFDAEHLSADDQRALRRLRPGLTGKRLRITGYTDNVGPQDYNDRLALRRARSVKAFLVAQGLNADHIEVRGHGKRGYRHSNDTPSGRAANRRAEIQFAPLPTHPTNPPGDS